MRALEGERQALEEQVVAVGGGEKTGLRVEGLGVGFGGFGLRNERYILEEWVRESRLV